MLLALAILVALRADAFAGTYHLQSSAMIRDGGSIALEFRSAEGPPLYLMINHKAPTAVLFYAKEAHFRDRKTVLPGSAREKMLMEMVAVARRQPLNRNDARKLARLAMLLRDRHTPFGVYPLWCR